jgi:hypothetical protein
LRLSSQDSPEKDKNLVTLQNQKCYTSQRHMVLRTQSSIRKGEKQMDTGTIGKWAFLIALVLGVLGGLLSAFGMDVLSGDAIITGVALLGLVGGLLYVAGMDRTAFFIAAAALTWFAAGGGSLYVEVLGNVVTGILNGAAVAAAAAAAGVLLRVVYEWIMPTEM